VTSEGRNGSEKQALTDRLRENMTRILKKFGWWSAVLALALSTVILPIAATAQDRDQQDQKDDPPSRVARIGYLEGSVSFQPAGEPDWVQAVANRPMTTGDNSGQTGTRVPSCNWDLL